MRKHGKKYNAAQEKIETGRKYNLEEAVAKVKEIAFAKFDETVELTVWLGWIPAKPTSWCVELSFYLTGSESRSEFWSSLKARKSKKPEEAGADFGGEDMVNKIKEAGSTLTLWFRHPT